MDGLSTSAGPLRIGPPTLCLAMFGGLIRNGVWCAGLIVAGGRAGQWLGKAGDSELKPPLPANCLLCAPVGAAWRSSNSLARAGCASLVAPVRPSTVCPKIPFIEIVSHR